MTEQLSCLDEEANVLSHYKPIIKPEPKSNKCKWISGESNSSYGYPRCVRMSLHDPCGSLCGERYPSPYCLNCLIGRAFNILGGNPNIDHGVNLTNFDMCQLTNFNDKHTELIVKNPNSINKARYSGKGKFGNWEWYRWVLMVDGKPCVVYFDEKNHIVTTYGENPVLVATGFLSAGIHFCYATEKQKQDFQYLMQKYPE